MHTFAQRLCRENSGQSMEVTKEMLARLPELDLEEGLRYAAQRNAEARGSDGLPQRHCRLPQQGKDWSGKQLAHDKGRQNVLS